LEKAKKNEKIDWCTDTVVQQYLGHADTKLTGVRLKTVKTGAEEQRPVQGAFMAIGHEPNTAVFKDQLEMDEGGYLLTAEGTTATSVPGVFAAGDVADHRYRQAITA